MIDIRDWSTWEKKNFGHQKSDLLVIPKDVPGQPGIQELTVFSLSDKCWRFLARINIERPVANISEVPR